mgnify:CR=1 FL=1
MTIRPAVQEDVREMMEIFNYEVRNSTASFAITEQSYEERLAWFQSHGGEYHPLLTAEQNGRVAGYACLSPYRPYEAYKRTAELSVYARFQKAGDWGSADAGTAWEGPPFREASFHHFCDYSQ